MRDSLLVAAGRLDLTLGGPSVQLTTAPFSTRRAVYGFIERQNLPAFFRTFDFANPNDARARAAANRRPAAGAVPHEQPVRARAGRPPRRSASKTSPDAGQPLTTSDEAADMGRIVRLFEYALGREPLGDETGDALEFIRAGEPSRMSARHAGSDWPRCC